MPNVIVDIDGVLADFEGEFCKVFNCYERRELIDLEKRLPSQANRIREWVKLPYTYQHLKTIGLGVEIVWYLYERGLDVCLVSSRPNVPGMFRVTHDWVRKVELPVASLSIGAGDKVDAVKRLKPFMIIDDIPSILEKSRSSGMFSVIFDQPWNKSASFPRISKMSDFDYQFSQCQAYMQMEYPYGQMPATGKVS